MGFFSSVGSFFSGAASAVWSGVKSVASGAWNAVKSVGGAIVRTAKSAWSAVASKVTDWKRLLLKTAQGALAGGTAGFKMGGWWGALVGALKGGAVSGYKEWKRQGEEKQQIEEDIEQVEYAQESASFQEDSELQQLGESLTRFIPKLTKMFSNDAPVESFEEYLRIDVSMTFVRDLVDKLGKITDPAQITKADRQMIVLVEKLVMDKNMSDTDLTEFDALVKARYGKSLLLMGGERQFAFWTMEEESTRRMVEVSRQNLNRIELRVKELRNRADYALDLNDQEKVELKKAEKDLVSERASYEDSRKYLRNVRFVSGAAEGLLQQAEADNSGKEISQRERERNDKAGAIIVNLENDIEAIRETGEIRLKEADARFLQQYVDVHMPEASARKKRIQNEFSSENNSTVEVAA